MRQDPENSEVLPVTGPTEREDPASDSEPASRASLWIEKHWPEYVTCVGLILFWLTCWYGEGLPIAALFIGPGIMFIGIVMQLRARGK